METMKLTKELQRIYNSEINFSISTFWDGGFNVKLGDSMNGFIAETTEDTIKDAIYWLIDKVLELHPGSLYSFSRMYIINKIRSGHVDTDKFTKEFLNKMVTGYEEKHPSIYQELEREYREKYILNSEK